MTLKPVQLVIKGNNSIFLLVEGKRNTILAGSLPWIWPLPRCCHSNLYQCSVTLNLYDFLEDLETFL
jgi:hypothetical protein